MLFEIVLTYDGSTGTVPTLQGTDREAGKIFLARCHVKIECWTGIEGIEVGDDEEKCEDTNFDAAGNILTDSGGDGCDWFATFPNSCGLWNTAEFFSD